MRPLLLCHRIQKYVASPVVMKRNLFDDRQIKVIKNRNIAIIFDDRQINMYNKGEGESF